MAIAKQGEGTRGGNFQATKSLRVSGLHAVREELVHAGTSRKQYRPVSSYAAWWGHGVLNDACWDMPQVLPASHLV